MEIQAVRIPRQKQAQLRPLRTLAGLEINEVGDELWLRAAESSEEIQLALKGLPAATAYRVLGDGQLCRLGSRVPHGFLPEGPWTSLKNWMRVELPSAALPGRISQPAPLRLIPGGRPRPANILLTSMEHWLAYGKSAPQVRLDRWRFAVSMEREVLIRGVPLPPIPGRQFVEDHGIAVPSGWHWSPAIDVDVLAEALGQTGQYLVFWRGEGIIERIAEEQFVRATRSAIRLSAEEVADG